MHFNLCKLPGLMVHITLLHQSKINQYLKDSPQNIGTKIPTSFDKDDIYTILLSSFSEESI